MLIGLAIYLYAMPLLPPDELQKARAAHVEKRPLDRGEWRAVVALLVLFVPNTLFWATYEQMGNTDRAVGRRQYRPRDQSLRFWAGEIPTTWFQAFNPFMIFAFTPFVVALWTRQAARGTEPSTISKMALGCLGVAAANLIMALAAFQAGGGKASWLWLFWLFRRSSPSASFICRRSGLSLVTKVAPARILSMMMGVWLATSFVGDFLAGYIGSFWSRMDKPEFFLLVAAIAALAGATIFACRWPLRGTLRE